MPSAQPEHTDQDTGKLSGLRSTVAQRSRRSAPPPRHHRTENPPETPAVTAVPDQPDEPTPVEPPAAAAAPPRRQGSYSRAHNIAAKHVGDAARTWAAQLAKTELRAASLAEYLAEAREAGVSREQLAEVVTDAIQRHGIEPTALPRDVARTAGIKRR